MRWFHTFLGIAAAFVLGVALAIALHPQPLFHDLVAVMRGGNAFDRCSKAGACNAMQSGPHSVPSRVPRLRLQEAPPDMDRA